MDIVRISHAALLAFVVTACVAPGDDDFLDDLDEDASTESAIAAKDLKSTTPFVSGKGYKYYRQPALVRAKNGDILAFAQGRSERSDDSDIDIVLRRSKDEGKTWAPQQVLRGKDSKDPVKNVSPVVLEDGTILALYLSNRYVTEEADRGCRRMHKIVSTDHGKTWSKPVDITSQTQKPCKEDSKGRWIDPPPPNHWGWTGLGPVHGIVKKSAPHAGRIVFAARHVDTNSKTYTHVIYSDDDGSSWKIGGSLDLRSTESTVVETSKGHLLVNSRSHGDSTYRIAAISKDGGASFEPAWVETQLPEPEGAQGSLVEHSTNSKNGKKNILFSNPKSTEERTNGTLQLSPDDGVTWTQSKGYSPAGHWSGYSDLVVLKNGDIGVLFEHGSTLKKDHEDVRFTIVPKGELGL
jgi:sialidase-1